MFSALKKLVGSEPAGQVKDKNIPAGLQSMNQSLQRRFAKGVQYNSKSRALSLVKVLLYYCISFFSPSCVKKNKIQDTN